MKKKAKKSGRAGTAHKQLEKELKLMHEATVEFVDACIEIAKTHPKGMSRIEKHVDALIDNMAKLDKMYAHAARAR